MKKMIHILPNFLKAIKYEKTINEINYDYLHM